MLASGKTSKFTQIRQDTYANIAKLKKFIIDYAQTFFY